MEDFIQLMKDINIGQLIAIGAMFWFFYTRLDAKIEKISDRLESKIDEVDRRLGDKIEDVDRRLCRIEGSLATQGHCLFSQNKPDRLVE